MLQLPSIDVTRQNDYWNSKHSSISIELSVLKLCLETEIIFTYIEIICFSLACQPPLDSGAAQANKT